MPKNILIDLNIILDVLLERKKFQASLNVLKLNESPRYKLYISAHIVTTFAYLLENSKVPKTQILKHIAWLLNSFTVVAVDKDMLKKAISSKVRDYEDAVIEAAAVKSNSLMIITRNVKDFKNSSVKPLLPEIFLDLYKIR